MEQKRVLLLANPISGRGAVIRNLSKIIVALEERYAEVTVVISKYRGHMEELAGQVSGYDLIVACGGDGTLNEVVNGMVKHGIDVPLGYIPVGTINDFATSHGIPKTVMPAVRSVVGGTAEYIDLGTLGDRVFAYVAAFGAFTETSYKTPQPLKNAFGKLAYIADGAMSISKIRPINARITVNGMIYEGDFLFGMTANSYSVGGMKIVRGDISLCDGLSEVMLVSDPGNISGIQNVIASLLNPKIECGYIISLSTDHAVFEFDVDIPWTVDGDFGGSGRRFETRTVKNAVRLVTPPKDGKLKSN